MTLTTRLTAVALAALAVVLAGFSAALYLVAREHLYRRADDRLAAAAAVLVAAAEVRPDGVEWEPAERRLGLGSGPGGDGGIGVWRFEPHRRGGGPHAPQPGRGCGPRRAAPARRAGPRVP